MVFLVEIISIYVMVSIVFVSRDKTMGFVMLFAINATGLECLCCSCGGPFWEIIQGRFSLPVYPSLIAQVHLIDIYLMSAFTSARRIF